MPTHRNEWFRDLDGLPTTSKHKDETKTYPIDFSGALDSGETISTIAVEANGVTVDSSAIASGIKGSNTAASLTVSDTDGTVKVSATTSASRVLVQEVRFIGVPMGRRESDYRG